MALYIITGPAGVGKSTISKEIAESLEKSVLIEGDDIYHHVVGSYTSPWKEGNHLDLFWKVSINTIRTYLEAGYDVVYNYIIEPTRLEKLKEEFKDYTIKFVVLMVSEEELIRRDNLRDEDCRMKERCIVLLNNFKKHNYSENNILYTDNISVKDCCNLIIKEEKYIIK